MNEHEFQVQEAALSELLNDPAASITDVTHLINRDKELTDLILARANSAIYGMRRRVTSLREAVVLMGFKNLEDVLRVRNRKALARRKKPAEREMEH